MTAEQQVALENMVAAKTVGYIDGQTAFDTLMALAQIALEKNIASIASDST